MRTAVHLPSAVADAESLDGTLLLSHDPETGCSTSLCRLGRSGMLVDLATPGYDTEYFVISGGLAEEDGSLWSRRDYRLVPDGFSPLVSVRRPTLLLRRTLLADLQRPRDAVSMDPDGMSWLSVGDPKAPRLHRLPLRFEVDRGDCSMLVQFDPGWRSPHGPHHHSTFEEVLVLDGSIVTDPRNYDAGTYLCKPAGTPQAPPRTENGALAWISHGGVMDFVPAPLWQEDALG